MARCALFYPCSYCVCKHSSAGTNLGGIVFGVSEHLQRSLHCLVGNTRVFSQGVCGLWCSTVKTLQAFSEGMEVSHQMCAQTLEDKSLGPQAVR